MKAKGLKKLLDSGKKVMAIWILANATIWVYLSYILAFMGREDIAEDLSSNVVTTVIAVFATYCVGSVVEHISEARYGTINTCEDTEDETI